MNDDDVVTNPWVFNENEEPPKDGTVFFAWDDQLEKLLTTMRWHSGDIQDFGTESEEWSGSFSYWMPSTKEPDLNNISSPYSY